MQKQAWVHLWGLLLRDAEASHEVGAKQSPAPVDKTELGAKREH
jgi:hypothetical protein